MLLALKISTSLTLYEPIDAIQKIIEWISQLNMKKDK
jgi:hypothetical protein